MENLKGKRLGYGYSNAKGEQMLVTEYQNNKRVVVKNLTTGTTHQCRWCDLQNVRCTAVYDATAARNRFKEDLDAARNRFNEELDKVSAIQQVKESEEWAFQDDLRRDYDEGNGGCASVVVGVSIVLVVVGLLAWLLW